MLTPNIAARLTRCVTTRQLKELGQLGCVLGDQQYLFTSQPTTRRSNRQKEPQPTQEWRDPIRLSVLLTSPLGHRSLNSI